MKFKVGDRVRVVRVNEPANFEPEIGFIFEIQKVDKDVGVGQYYYDETYDLGWMYEDELELVEETTHCNKEWREEMRTKTKPIKNNANKPQKLDDGKPRMDLIRPEFLIELGIALEYGQNKYNEQIGEVPNYLKGKGFHYTRLIGSTLRHFTKWCSGTRIDEESGINHLILAAVNIMFLFTYDTSDKGIDDRTFLDSEEK